ncbi:KPN_02809 family neutral zinc metallopeptidase [Pseudogemmobacter faecipullorum]|uniref:Neutral zinc metallopeptidase n=1 Tax=Pseudogemmobacter faecipullorum TaxID=2755041 RepID=A0ABS8CJ05_9RHOB|nr:neutral zinc metallopeptidase [Pseudogemmobacter faecipullorum]MCB5409125.1 neutral zinc metallopeptidase [Pseudogemmobacter faecipullorum]
MQWKGRRSSRNIEDRRGQGGGGGLRSGGVAGAGGLGVVVVFVIAMLLGVDPRHLLEGAGGSLSGGSSGSGSGQSAAPLSAEEQQAGEFVSVVLADTEEIWTRLFADQLNRRYTPPVLVLFSTGTQSPCGGASAATGPFYCPADNKVYLDTSFFATMEHQLGAKGDFAAAYVVAHEVGHHIQDALGILSEANEIRAKVSERESNEISVRIELQADCLSGIWAREAQASLGVVEPGDFDEALQAARQIGDDTLQRAAGRRPMPHSFTHGSAEQRQRWFATGLQSGRIADCDTFRQATL